MVEWNPHIINKINKKAVEKLCKKEAQLRDSEKSIKEKTVIFLQKYNEASNIIHSLPKTSFKVNQRIPLAYKLNPQLSDITDKDILALPKFGGIPDMTWWYSFVIDYGKVEGKETQKLYNNIEKEWPICGCCHKPMRFLGQIDITDWARVIHLLTYEDRTTEEYQKNDRHYYQISGLGSGNQNGLTNISHDLWWYFFYCDCFNYGVEGYSAVILLKHKFQGFKGGIPNYISDMLKVKDLDDKTRKHFEEVKKVYDPVERDKCLWPKEEYRATVEEFMEKNNVHPEMAKSDQGTGKIPLQFVKGFDLGFDLDFPGVIHDDLYGAIYYGAKKQYQDIFGHRGTYQLFGRPSSQQEEPRYMCSYGYDQGFHGYKLHRKAPLICWDDFECDMTRQMYGCLRCTDSECDTVWAKMDNSCT